MTFSLHTCTHTPEINNRRTLRISSDVPSLTCCRSSLQSASKCHKASCFRSKPWHSEEQECMSDFLHTGNDAEQRLWVKQDRCWPLILGELRITEQNDHSRDCGKSSAKAAVHNVSMWSDTWMAENAEQDGAETSYFNTSSPQKCSTKTNIPHQKPAHRARDQKENLSRSFLRLQVNKWVKCKLPEVLLHLPALILPPLVQKTQDALLKRLRTLILRKLRRKRGKVNNRWDALKHRLRLPFCAK